MSHVEISEVLFVLQSSPGDHPQARLQLSPHSCSALSPAPSGIPHVPTGVLRGLASSKSLPLETLSQIFLLGYLT